MALIDKLTALGDAIREQTGKPELLSLDAMVTEIKNINFSKTTPINVVPSTNSSFTYDGTTKTPVWQNYDSEQLTISGATSATNAGTYAVYFTPKAGYTWADESVESKAITWSIAKATGTLSLSATSGTIYGSHGKATITATYNGDAAILASSSNTGVATVSVSAKTITIQAVATGSATITVSTGESNNFTTPDSVTYALTVDKLWLFNSGNQFDVNTGGWKGVNSKYLTAIGTYLQITEGGSSGDSQAALYTKNKIDVTQYSTLTVVMQQIRNGVLWGGDDVKIGMTTGNTSSYPTLAASTSHGTSESNGKTMTVNIASLSGSYYPCITAHGMTCNVSQVYIT